MVQLLQTCVLFLLVFKSAIHIDADAACKFPSELRSGTWHSSDMGDVTFNKTHFTASKILDFENLVLACDTNDDDGRYYVVSESFDYLSGTFKVALCFSFTRSSANKYFYYPMTSLLGSSEVNRIIFNVDTFNFQKSATCQFNDKKISNTRVLIKEGFINTTSSRCNNGIAGTYEYNVSTSSCSSTWMDACSDKKDVVFNMTICSDTMAFSTNGSLSCVWNRNVNNRYYTLLYNKDTTTDESTTYRYTCLMAKKVSGVTYVTTYPRACPDDGNRTNIASRIEFTMTSNSTCGTDTDEGDSTANAGAAAAVVIALLILLAACAVVAVWYYIKVYRVKKVNPDVIPAKSPPIDTKEQERMDGRVSPFSPYPTVSELAVYRFGPSPGPEIDDDDGGMTLEATTPGFTDGRRTMYGKDPERESQVSLPLYSEVGGETPEPTRLSEVHTRMSEISEVNIADPTTMTRATMNIPEETRVSPLQTPEVKPNGEIQSPRDNDVAL